MSTYDSHDSHDSHYGERPLRVGLVMQVLAQGGLEELVVRLALALQREGHKPTILALEEGPLRARIEGLGIPLHSFRKQPGLDTHLWWRLFGELRYTYDVLHTHHFGPLFYASPAARCAGVPVLHTMHSNEHLRGAGRRHAWMMRAGLHLSEGITTVHEGLRDFLVARWPRLAAKTEALPNGVDTTLFHGDHETHDLRASLSIPAGALVVGCVARLSKEKGHERLLAALAAMEAQPYVVLVGAGEEEARLQAQAQALGLDARLRWLGTRYDTPALLSLCDIFALASLREGLPLAALEAMASKLPLVTTDVGGLPALLQESGGGVCVPSGDTGAFAQALDALLADPSQRATLGAAGRRWVCEHASSDAMFRRYLALYTRLASGARGEGG